MSRTSQKMNSLSSTGSFMRRGQKRIITFRVIGGEFAMAGSRHLLLQAGRFRVELLLLHPTQEGLPGDFAGVSVTFGELLLNELLNRLCDRDFHAVILAQEGSPGKKARPSNK